MLVVAFRLPMFERLYLFGIAGKLRTRCAQGVQQALLELMAEVYFLECFLWGDGAVGGQVWITELTNISWTTFMKNYFELKLLHRIWEAFRKVLFSCGFLMQEKSEVFYFFVPDTHWLLVVFSDWLLVLLLQIGIFWQRKCRLTRCRSNFGKDNSYP